MNLFHKPGMYLLCHSKHNTCEVGLMVCFCWWQGYIVSMNTLDCSMFDSLHLCCYLSLSPAFRIDIPNHACIPWQIRYRWSRWSFLQQHDSSTAVVVTCELGYSWCTFPVTSFVITAYELSWYWAIPCNSLTPPAEEQFPPDTINLGIYTPY